MKKTDRVIIKRKQKPVLVGRKVKSIGEIYYEVNYWDGCYWKTMQDYFQTLQEAKNASQKYDF